jgi:hypothetical protein
LRAKIPRFKTVAKPIQIQLGISKMVAENDTRNALKRVAVEAVHNPIMIAKAPEIDLRLKKTGVPIRV